MTNTIPNVPRELLERVLNAGWGSETVNALDDLRDFLASAPSPANHVEDVRAMVAAPSPAGVDGLEVVGWYRMDGRKDITPYPSVCATWHKMGVKVGAAYSDSAQAIIDGLRGENEALHAQVKVLQSDANSWQSGYDEGRRMGGKHCALTIDRQAQRIGELETALEFACKSLAQVTSSDGSGHADIAVSVLRMAGTKDADALHVVEAYKAGAKWRIDAALSAGKEGE